jgi:phosphoglycerol transferase MdoB-like AlkP superfamily enzyme
MNTSIKTSFERFISGNAVSGFLLIGILALLAAFKITFAGDVAQDELFREWVISWSLIWFIAAIAFSLVLKPMFAALFNNKEYFEAQMLKEMFIVQPNFRQELLAMSARDDGLTNAERKAVEAREARDLEEALAPMGFPKTGSIARSELDERNTFGKPSLLSYL